MGKFGPKNQHCQFKLKFGNYTNSNMQSSMVLFTFSVLDFLGKFSLKNQNYQFKLKFGSQNNSNRQNSMVLFTFSVLDAKQPFWATLVQKLKLSIQAETWYLD